MWKWPIFHKTVVKSTFGLVACLAYQPVRNKSVRNFSNQLTQVQTTEYSWVRLIRVHLWSCVLMAQMYLSDYWHVTISATQYITEVHLVCWWIQMYFCEHHRSTFESMSTRFKRPCPRYLFLSLQCFTFSSRPNWLHYIIEPCSLSTEAHLNPWTGTCNVMSLSVTCCF